MATAVVIALIFGLGYFALAIFILIKSIQTKDVEYSAG
jgi:hypothetical protein